MATTFPQRSDLEQECKPAEARRTKPAQPVLSRLELACMKAIWCDGAKTVLQVQQQLKPKRPLAYTTVLTVLDRLVRKGALARIKQGKAYHYDPALSYKESRQKALAELTDFYFEGSLEKLLEFLSDTSTSPEAKSSADQTSMESPEINVALL
ncbi:MAG TPA: BlaI/MecI/CopY family transcriptional regulator [Terriglobia bacterium]|nr:BlaI/MecI/CopY family transcriptional regulator [Terriglobia bacterium]